VVKDLVVKCKVVTWNNVNAGILLNLPMCKTQPLSLCYEIFLGELATPVSLGGLFQITKDSHAGKSQDGGLNHDCNFSFRRIETVVRGEEMEEEEEERRKKKNKLGNGDN
jgi:hypothetical protein